MSWTEELPRPAATSPERLGARESWIARREDRGSYPTWVLFAALAGMFATTFPITILTIALGSIAQEFAVSETTIVWVITAPMLFSAVTLPLLGKLGDLHGHRKVFLLGFLAATVTAAATALAWNAWSLIALRTLAAVVGGATQPTAMALIFGVYDPSERVRAMGWWSMTTAAAPALGLVLGGPLVDWLGWRVVFVFQAIFSLVALVLAAWVLRETDKLQVRMDFKGVATLMIAVAGIMSALGLSREDGLLAPHILALFVLGGVGLAWFVRVEQRTAEPLLELDFFRIPNFTWSLVSNAFQGASYMGAFVLAPLVLGKLFGFSISQTAAIMLLRTLTLTLSSPVGGRLGMRIGERGASVVGSTFLTVSLFVIAWATQTMTFWAFCTGLVLQGMGHGLALPSLNSAVANSVPERDLGIASAGTRLMGGIGTAFGITVMTIVYGGNNVSSTFASAYLVGAGFAAISLLAAWLMTSMEETACPDAARS